MQKRIIKTLGLSVVMASGLLLNAPAHAGGGFIPQALVKQFNGSMASIVAAGIAGAGLFYATSTLMSRIYAGITQDGSAIKKSMSELTPKMLGATFTGSAVLGTTAFMAPWIFDKIGQHAGGIFGFCLALYSIRAFYRGFTAAPVPAKPSDKPKTADDEANDAVVRDEMLAKLLIEKREREAAAKAAAAGVPARP